MEEALLTPATKLYKTAGFFEKTTDNREEAVSDLNNVWHVGISDSQISQTDGKAAAQYFYSSFLGCGYPQSSAKTTREFYEATCEFLTGMDISDEERNDLLNRHYFCRRLLASLKY